MTMALERRQFDRFELPAMYTRITIRAIDQEEMEWDGNAYDISRGGVRFEADKSFEPGTEVAMRIDLPRAPIERSSEPRSVFVFGTIVWLEDDDQPGPYKMAAVFTRFEQPEDEALLMRRIANGRYSIAA